MTRPDQLRLCPETKPCANCRKDFNRRQCESRKVFFEKRVFCSRECRREFGEKRARITKANAKARHDPFTRFWSNVDIREPDDCWEWKAPLTPQGYGWFWMDGGKAHAHRQVLRLAGVDVPSESLVCHHCDNPPCVNPAHLYVGLHSDNMADAARRGRMAKGLGEKWGKARLRNADIPKIRALLKAGETQRAVALRFGVHPAHISRIKTGKRWKDF